MQRLDALYAEAEAPRTPDEWQAFEKRWLEPSAWPRRKPPGTDAIDSDRLPKRDARRWSTSCHAYDLTPEARHRYHN
jgi:hypothetical protein